MLPLDDPATTIDRAIIHAGQRRTRRAGKSTITSCGIEIEDFRIDNAPARIAKVGDLWAPILPSSQPRVDLRPFLGAVSTRGH